MANRVVFFSVLILSAMNLSRTDENKSSKTKSLVKMINQFGSDLLNGSYSKIAAEDNLLVSPINVYAALALLHLGATGQTRQDLSAVMKVAGNVENYNQMHERLNSILSQIHPPKRDEPESSSNKLHETKLANGIFLQKDFPIKSTYEALAKKYYNGPARNLDFVHEPRKATDFINEWISVSTKGRIDKFYEQPLLSDTIAVLVSALYFKASWQDAFPPAYTKIEQFTAGSTEIQLPMMNKQNRMRYSHDDRLHYDSVSLLYSGEQHEMTIYLQHTEYENDSSPADLFHTLAEKNFAPDTTKTYNQLVNLKLPKMKFSWRNSLVSALNLGAIFKSANLSEMTPCMNVEVSNMIHATELEVDENGTIASAATGIRGAGMSAHIDPVINFHVNRPFLMTITHRPTGTILFAGIVRKPITV